MVRYSIKEINNYSDKLNSISYHVYNAFIDVAHTTNLTEELMIKNEFDDLCVAILKTKRVKKTEIINVIQKDIVDFSKYDYLIKIKEKLKKNKNNLLIANYINIYKQIIDIDPNIKNIIFENTEIEKDKFIKLIEKDKLNYITIDDLLKNIALNKNDKNDKNEKYDNIITKISEFLDQQTHKYFVPSKLPDYMLVITASLNLLKVGGTLFYFGRVGVVNSAFEKIINLLSNSFDKIKIEYTQQSSLYLMICEGFKNNIDKQTLDTLSDICLNTQKYKYSTCQIMHYMYHLAKTQPNKQLMYPLDLNFIDIAKSYKSKQTTMPIIDDIDINTTESLTGQYVIFELNKMYQSYFDNVNLNILRYVKENENGQINIDEEYINKNLYDKLNNLITSLEQLKIPYNKAYLSYIDKFNKNIYNNLYSFKNAIHYTLLKYKQHTSRRYQTEIMSKIGQYDQYYYPEMNDAQDMFDITYRIRNDLLEEVNYDPQLKNMKHATEDFARGVSAYIMKNYKLDGKISNGFCKLWEIFNTISGLLPNRKKIKTFHLAEAPGQWIHATHYYYYTKKSNASEYDWRANSLNPNNAKNKEKYVDIFSDDYGYMKRYKDRWLWGVDNTGDITSGDNLKWYHQYAIEWSKKQPIDLVTGDAGIPSPDPNVFQKIEFAQICMVAGISSVGGNCIIKHFLPYQRKVPITYYANGNFMCNMFLYYLMFEQMNLIKPLTSNPNSGEFYVVCKGFRGIKENDFDKLVNVVENYKVNQCIFSINDIPEEFTTQVIEFVNKLITINTDNSELGNLLITCFSRQDPIIKEKTNCDKYLSPKYIDEIQKVRFQEWITKMKFE